MATKRKAVKSVKAVRARKSPSKAKKETALLLDRVQSAKEVAALEHLPLKQNKGEIAWLGMMSTPLKNEDDRWSLVEEHLLAEPREREHSIRRWKYFAK